jgi:N-glycosylase/DNA lyase
MEQLLSTRKAAKLLHDEHCKRKEGIGKRLQQFRDFYDTGVSWFFDGGMELRPVLRADDERIFEELCFCILTANTSAEMGMKSIDTVRDLLIMGSMQEMKARLEGIYRFKTLRPGYIVHTREYLQQEHGFRLKGIIESLRHDKEALREFFASNPGIKGLGYKEASHFLRNIGISGYAILDKHIVRSLFELGVIAEMPKSMTPRRYKDLEGRMRKFSDSINIPMDELDLLLWSMKTGKVLK